MKLPIFGDNQGDLAVFDSLESARSYVEMIDIENRAWTFYDSEGRLIRPEVSKRNGDDWLEFVDGERQPTGGESLRQAILRSLKATPGMSEPFDHLQLDELVRLFVAVNGGR